jgi:hypothetical protein
VVAALAAALRTMQGLRSDTKLAMATSLLQSTMVVTFYFPFSSLAHPFGNKVSNNLNASFRLSGAWYTL